MPDLWYWPGDSEINDFPDPLGIEDQWIPWTGTMESGPSVFAEIFSREYIQNSWDSIQEKAKSPEVVGAGKPAISFRFVELTGQDAKEFAQNFGLKEHADRLGSMEDDVLADQRLGDTFLKSEDFSSIKLLVASEAMAEGMFGRWNAGDLKQFHPPRMRISLIQSMTGKIGEGTGGSWGQGKKAVAAASRSRILGVYSCFPDDPTEPDERRSDPDVTRRFMGVTYWRPHTSETKRHRGLGLCGARDQESPAFSNFSPIVNDTADSFVEELNIPGMEVRDPSNVRDHGTSYLFVDPSFEPDELIEAIERNWWPLLESHRVDIEVLGYDGEPLEISPGSRENLFPFIKALGLAQGADQLSDDTEIKGDVSVSGMKAGVLAITSDISDAGWSYDTTENGNADLVALVRRDMVIAYQRYPRLQRRKPPYVRGVFVASSQKEVNETLKMSEGHLHNSWKDNPRDAISPEVARFAKTVLDHIDRRVKDLRAKISTSTENDSFRIRAFEKLFAGKGPALGSSGPPPPPPDRRRDFSIQNVSQVIRDFDPKDPSKLRFKASAKISIRPDHVKDFLTVEVNLGWAVFEEAGPKRDLTLSDLKNIDPPPEGFSNVGGKLIGILSKEPKVFEWSSNYFPNDWQVVPDPRVAGTGGDDE